MRLYEKPRLDPRAQLPLSIVGNIPAGKQSEKV